MFDALGILALGEVPIQVVIIPTHPGSGWGSKRRRRREKYVYTETEEAPQWQKALEAANEAKFNKLVEEEKLRLVRENNLIQPRKPKDHYSEIKKEIEQRINPAILEIKQEVQQRIEAAEERKNEPESILRDRIREIDRAEALERAHEAIREKMAKREEISNMRLKNLSKARKVKKKLYEQK
jgi:hypothetical protein